MFVRQSNHLYETHFVHCEEVENAFNQRKESGEEPTGSRVVEGYVQEARLSRWAAEFNARVITPLVELSQNQQRKKFYAKFFELRPYNYALI